MDNVTFGKTAETLFDDNSIEGSFDEFSSAFCVKLGEAVAAASGRKRVGVCAAHSRHEAHTPHHEYGALHGAHSKRITRSLLCGLASGGSQTYEFDGATPAEAAFFAKTGGCEVTLCVRVSESRVRIFLYDKDGLYPERSFERKIADYLNNESVFNGEYYETQQVKTASRAYLDAVTDYCTVSLSGMKIVFESDNAATNTAKNAVAAAARGRKCRV